MRSSRFSDEQIIGMIKEQEAGMPTAEVCRKHVTRHITYRLFLRKIKGELVLRSIPIICLSLNSYKVVRTVEGVAS